MHKTFGKDRVLHVVPDRDILATDIHTARQTHTQRPRYSAYSNRPHLATFANCDEV